MSGDSPPTTDGHTDGGSNATGGRAVSYALGFVVVFSVAVAGTLALFVVGLDLLSEADRDETVVAAEENLEVVYSEVGEMVTQGDERRELRLELADAQVGFAGSDTVRLRVESGNAALDSVVYETRTLRYEIVPKEVTFVYALGHVYRIGESGGAVSERAPVFEVSEGQTRLVVPVLTGPTADSPTTVGVSGTGERALVALRSGLPRSLTRTGTGGTDSDTAVETIAGTVTVESTDHPSVWVTALETTGFEDVTVTAGGTVTGAFESERLTIRRADIDFALGGETRP